MWKVFCFPSQELFSWMLILWTDSAHWSRNKGFFQLYSSDAKSIIVIYGDHIEGGQTFKVFIQPLDALLFTVLSIIRSRGWGQQQHDLLNENALLISWFPSEIKVIYFSLLHSPPKINSKDSWKREEEGGVVNLDRKSIDAVMCMRCSG